MEPSAPSGASGSPKPSLKEAILYEFTGDLTHETFLVTDTELGSGNFASVHRGVYKRDPTQQVAIKITRRNTNYNPERYKKYLEREIEFVRMKLQHPNVLQFIDFFFDEGTRVFLVMEFCDAGTLKNFMSKNKPLKESDIQYFFVQIVRGLKYLHDREIVHRDLKPDNFLLKTDSGGKLVLKISDFGLARQIITDDDEMKMTALGTPLYVSPEIYGGVGYGFGTDLWGIGAILFEMVEGEHLLNQNLIQLLRSKKPFDIVARFRRSRTIPHIPELLQKLLSFDPKDRCNLDWLLDHPFIKGQGFMLKFRVFVVNRAQAQDVILQVPPANYVEALLDELNSRVPPFVKGHPGASIFAPTKASSSPPSRHSPPPSSGDSSWAAEKPRPVLRIYLFEDGTPLHLVRSLEDLMRQREIFMFHLEDPNSELVVEDDFILVDSVDYGSGAASKAASVKSPAGAMDEVNRQLVLKSKQASGLAALLRYLNARFSEMEDIELTYSLPRMLKEERDRLKMILLVKLKDLTPKSPTAAYNYFDQFWILLAQVEQISRKLDQMEDEKKRLVDKLLHSQQALVSLSNSVDRASVKRDQLKRFVSSASIIDATMAANFREWVIDELTNRERTRELRLLSSTIVQSHLNVDSLLNSLTEIRKILIGHSESIQKLKEAIQDTLDKSRDAISTTESEIRSLQNELSQVRMQLSLEQEKRLSTESEKSSLASQLESARAQLDSAERRVSILEDSMLERNRLARELEAERAAKDLLMEENRLLGDNLVELKANWESRENHLLTQHKKEMEHVVAEIEDLKDQLEKIQVASSPGNSIELTRSQGEGIVDIVLHNLDEKNKELLEAKEELTKVQNAFMDEKEQKREIRSQLEVALEEKSKLLTEIKLLNDHLREVEVDRISFSDFQTHGLAMFARHPQGFYFMLYEPSQSASNYCWVLVDPFQIPDLPQPALPFLVVELLTTPQFEEAQVMTKHLVGMPGPPIGSPYVNVMVNPRVELSTKLIPPGKPSQ